VSQKGTLFFFCFYVTSFAPPKEVTKKKRPEKTTVPVFLHLRYAIFRSKKQEAVRTFSGLPTHPAKALIL
jgi:hypothetical protein